MDNLEMMAILANLEMMVNLEGASMCQENLQHLVNKEIQESK